MEGPQEHTVLDQEPDQKIDRIQVVRAIPCNVEVWEKAKKWHGAQVNKKKQRS